MTHDAWHYGHGTCGAPQAWHPCMRRYQGSMWLTNRKNLPNKRSFGKQNPFACVSVDHTTLRTRYDRRGGQQPFWDDQLNFEIYDDLQDLVLTSAGVQDANAPPASKVLRISCGAEGKDAEVLGEGVLSLSTVLNDGEHDTWIPIFSRERYSGEVYVELTFYSAEPPPQMGTHHSLTDVPHLLRDNATNVVYTPPYAPQSIFSDMPNREPATPVHRHSMIQPRKHMPALPPRSQSTSTIFPNNVSMMQSFSDLAITEGADDSADWTNGYPGPDDSTDSIEAQLQQLPPLPEPHFETERMAWPQEVTAQEAIYGTTSPKGRRPLPVATPLDPITSPARAASMRVPTSPMRQSLVSISRAVSSQVGSVSSQRVASPVPARASSPGVLSSPSARGTPQSGATPMQRVASPAPARVPSPGLLPSSPLRGTMHTGAPALRSTAQVPARVPSPGFAQAVSPVTTRSPSPAVMRAPSPAIASTTSPARQSMSPSMSHPVTPTTPTGRRPLPSPGVSPVAAQLRSTSPGQMNQAYGIQGRAGAPRYM